MSSAPIPRDPDSRTASQVRRGATSAAPSSYRVVRNRFEGAPQPDAADFASANYHDTRTTWDATGGSASQMVPDTLESSVGAASTYFAYDVSDFYGVETLVEGWYSGWAVAMAQDCDVATIEIFADPVMVEGFLQVHRAISTAVLSLGFDAGSIFLSCTSTPVFCTAGTLWRASVYGDGALGATVTQARFGLIHHA